MVFKMLKWNFGFLNYVIKKYFMLEMFGFKLNVDGILLRKK